MEELGDLLYIIGPSLPVLHLLLQNESICAHFGGKLVCEALNVQPPPLQHLTSPRGQSQEPPGCRPPFTSFWFTSAKHASHPQSPTVPRLSAGVQMKDASFGSEAPAVLWGSVCWHLPAVVTCLHCTGMLGGPSEPFLSRKTLMIIPILCGFREITDWSLYIN